MKSTTAANICAAIIKNILKTNKKQIVYVFDAENPGKEFHGMVTAMIEYEGSGEMKLIATP